MYRLKTQYANMSMSICQSHACAFMCSGKGKGVLCRQMENMRCKLIFHRHFCFVLKLFRFLKAGVMQTTVKCMRLGNIQKLWN